MFLSVNVHAKTEKEVQNKIKNEQDENREADCVWLVASNVCLEQTHYIGSCSECLSAQLQFPLPLSFCYRLHLNASGC